MWFKEKGGGPHTLRSKEATLFMWFLIVLLWHIWYAKFAIGGVFLNGHN